MKAGEDVKPNVICKTSITGSEKHTFETLFACKELVMKTHTLERAKNSLKKETWKETSLDTINTWDKKDSLDDHGNIQFIENILEEITTLGSEWIVGISEKVLTQRMVERNFFKTYSDIV